MAFTETLSQRLARKRRESIRPPGFGEDLGFALQFVQKQGAVPKLPPFGGTNQAPPTDQARTTPTPRRNLFSELDGSSQAVATMVRSIARARQQSLIQTAREMDIEERYPDVFRALFPQARFFGAGGDGIRTQAQLEALQNKPSGQAATRRLNPDATATPLFGDRPGSVRERSTGAAFANRPSGPSSANIASGAAAFGQALITPLSDQFGFTPDIPILKEVIQVLTDPITIFTLGMGTPFSAGVRGARAARSISFLRGTSPIARAGATGGNIAATGRVATLVDRAVLGSIERSLRVTSTVLQPFGTGYRGAIAEIAAGTAGLFAANAVPEDAGLPWQIAAGFAGGAVGAAAVLKGPAAERAIRATLTKNLAIPGMERSRNMRSQVMGTAGRFMANEDGGVTPRPNDRTAGPPAPPATGEISGRQYQFQWRIIDLDEAIVSHDIDFNPNPAYPQELQPRLRDRMESRIQILREAADLNRDSQLTMDSAYLDRGAPIIGGDGVVEAGNGRFLMMKVAREHHPDLYNDYVKEATERAVDLGFDDDAFRAVGANLVLVRERLTKLTDAERRIFTQEANGSATLAPQPFEVALQDAGNITEEMLGRFKMSTAENATVLDSLFLEENTRFINDFVNTMPAPERSRILDGETLLTTGALRIENAMYARTYTGEAGRRIVTIFSELRDPEVVGLKHAIGVNLGKMVRAKALMAANLRNPALDMTEDIAQALHYLAVLRRSVKLDPKGPKIGVRVAEYVQQASLHADSSPTSLEADRLLVMMHDEARTPLRLARALDAMSEGIIDSTNTDVKQAGLAFGTDAGTATKEGLIDRAQELIDKERLAAFNQKWEDIRQKHADSGKGGDPPRQPDPPASTPGRQALDRRGATPDGSTTPDAPPPATAVDRPGSTGGVNRHNMFSDGTVQDEVIDTAAAAAAAKTANRTELVQDPFGPPREVEVEAVAVDTRGQITREKPESTARRKKPKAAAVEGPPVAAGTRAAADTPDIELGPTVLEKGLLKAESEGIAGGGGPGSRPPGPPEPPRPPPGQGGVPEDLPGGVPRKDATPFPERSQTEAPEIRTPSDMLDQIIPAAGLSTRGPFKNLRNKLFGFGSESIPQAIWRDFKGASARFNNDLTNTMLRHDSTLLDAAKLAGIAHTRHGPGGKLIRFTNYEDVHPVYLHLMGEGPKPDWFPQSVVDEMKEVLFQEGLLMKEIDGRFMPTPDYFPRLFKQPEGTTANIGSKTLGGKPGFTLPRNGATYQEMVDLGWRPRFNNPVHTFAERLRAGDEYRQQRKLILHMEDANMVIKLGQFEDPPDGWRVPKAGPDMEGKSIIAQRRPATGEAVSLEIQRADKRLKNDLGFYGVTQRRAVPNRMADLLEGGFGDNYVWAQFSKFGFKSDVITVLKVAGQVAKRIKLFLSFFQQMDFFQRATWAAFSPTAIAHSKGGSVAELPLLLGRFVYANVSSGRRDQLRRSLHDTTPYLKDEKWKDLTPDLLMRHNRNPMDTSIVNRDTILEIMADVGEPRNLPRGLRKAADITEPIRRRFKQLENALQAGLFDGVYIEAQNFALKHHIIPSLAKAHPEWSSATMAKQAVNDVNLMFSTIGEWQTVLRSRPVREVLHNLMFSSNETESLLRQSFSTIKGPNKRLWAEFYIGGALSLTVVATAVNLAINGEFLPLDRLSPVSFSRFNTFGVGYNNKFFLADLGNVGRNGGKLGLDLLGQMDTVLRTLNPLAFFDSRTAVVPRAVINQIQGEDFFGRSITDVGDRAMQLFTDLGMPIGLGNLAGAAGIGAENEGRLGTVGQIVQSFGPNLRAEPSPDLKNRYAQNDFGRDWDELWGYEKTALFNDHPNLQDELEIRREESARNGNEFALTQENFDVGQELRLEAQSVSDVDLENGTLTARQWRDAYQIRQAQQLGASQESFGRDTITDAKNGFERYLQIIQRNILPNLTPDWIQIDIERKMLSPDDQANLNIQLSSGKTPTVQRYRTALVNLNQSGFFRLEETAWAQMQIAGQGEVLTLARRFESWDEFESYAMRTLEASLTPDFGVTARDEATRHFNRIPLVQQFRELKNLHETRWLETTPRALAEEAVFWQFLTTNLEQREFLTGLPLTAPPAPPRAPAFAGGRGQGGASR